MKALEFFARGYMEKFHNKYIEKNKVKKSQSNGHKEWVWRKQTSGQDNEAGDEQSGLVFQSSHKNITWYYIAAAECWKQNKVLLRLQRHQKEKAKEDIDAHSKQPTMTIKLHHKEKSNKPKSDV